MRLTAAFLRYNGEKEEREISTILAIPAFYGTSMSEMNLIFNHSY